MGLGFRFHDLLNVVVTVVEGVCGYMLLLIVLVVSGLFLILI